MDFVELKNRKQQVSCVGIELFDTHIYFIELQFDAVSEQLVPSKHGRVGITFDVVENGSVINKTKALESVKKIHTQVQTQQVVIGSLGSEVLDEQWQELFAVAGFSSVSTIPLHQALVNYAGRRQVNIAYFKSPTDLLIVGPNVRVQQFTYPLDVNGILDLQDMTAAPENNELVLSGHFKESPHDTLTAFGDYSVPARLENVWRKCFALENHIPIITRDESFDYMGAIALAHSGSLYTVHTIATNTNKSDAGQPKPQHSEPTLEKKTLQEHLGPVAEDIADITGEVPESPMVQSYLPKPGKFFLPKNKKIQKKVLPKPVVQKKESKTGKQVIQKKKTAIDNTTVVGSEVTKKSKPMLLLRDVDEMIYSLFKKK